MTADIWVAIIALMGTLGGSFAGVLTSAKLTNFRLQQLEDKVKAHNNLAERLAVVEQISRGNTQRISQLEER